MLLTIISKLRRKESIDVFGLNTSYKERNGRKYHFLSCHRSILYRLCGLYLFWKRSDLFGCLFCDGQRRKKKDEIEGRMSFHEFNFWRRCRSDDFDGDRRAGQIRMDENRRAHLGCCAGHSYFCPCSPKGNKKIGEFICIRF